VLILNSSHLTKILTKILIITNNNNNIKTIINFHTSAICYYPKDSSEVSKIIKEDSLSNNSNINYNNSIDASMKNNGFVSKTIDLTEVNLEEFNLESSEQILTETEEQINLSNYQNPLTDNQKLLLYEKYNTKMKLGINLTPEESETLHNIYDDFTHEGIFTNKLSTPHYKFYLETENIKNYSESND
jgi:hypothetical protein